MATHEDLKRKLIARSGRRCECTLCSSHAAGKCGSSVERSHVHCIVPGQPENLGTMELLCDACYELACQTDARYWMLTQWEPSAASELT